MKNNQMKNRHKRLMSLCSEMNFGKIEITDEEKEFCRKFNNEIILLCKSLPKSIHADAILFFTEYLVTPIGRELNFFANYYAPAWSILFWLIQACPADRKLNPEDIESSVSAHTMALLLHPLDDHLNDGQLPATHLHLLLRSQSWTIMQASLDRLYNNVRGGAQIGRQFIDDYYQSISDSEEIESLDRYCKHFRKQMATWLIVPVLLAKQIASDEVFIDAIQRAFGSFGIAWRLLDDIRDIETDMLKGNHSAIYVCLPGDKRQLWDGFRAREIATKKDDIGVILDNLIQNNLIDKLTQRTCAELESAANLVETFAMTQLADEFRCLAAPLMNSHARKW